MTILLMDTLSFFFIMKINKYISRGVLIAFVVLINIGCDQQTKKMAQDNLEMHHRDSYFYDLFQLQLAENKGAFLSSFSESEGNMRFWTLQFFPILMLVFLLMYTLFSKQLNHLQIIALSFIIGGGISNIIDRLLYGAVTDFMIVGVGSLRTGIFNFADLSIMIGMILFLIINFRQVPPTGLRRHPNNNVRI